MRKSFFALPPGFARTACKIDRDTWNTTLRGYQVQNGRLPFRDVSQDQTIGGVGVSVRSLIVDNGLLFGCTDARTAFSTACSVASQAGFGCFCQPVWSTRVAVLLCCTGLWWHRVTCQVYGLSFDFIKNNIAILTTMTVYKFTPCPATLCGKCWFRDTKTRLITTSITTPTSKILQDFTCRLSTLEFKQEFQFLSLRELTNCHTQCN